MTRKQYITSSHLHVDEWRGTGFRDALARIAGSEARGELAASGAATMSQADDVLSGMQTWACRDNGGLCIRFGDKPTGGGYW